MIARQVRCQIPELLQTVRDPDTGETKLKYPCPRATPLVTVVNPEGRTTVPVGELGRFGVESDAFISVCEGRVLLSVTALETCNIAREQVQEDLRPRTWVERLTPWKD